MQKSAYIVVFLVVSAILACGQVTRPVEIALSSTEDSFGEFDRVLVSICCQLVGSSSRNADLKDGNVWLEHWQKSAGSSGAGSMVGGRTYLKSSICGASASAPNLFSLTFPRPIPTLPPTVMTFPLSTAYEHSFRVVGVVTTKGETDFNCPVTLPSADARSRLIYGETDWFSSAQGDTQNLSVSVIKKSMGKDAGNSVSQRVLNHGFAATLALDIGTSNTNDGMGFCLVDKATGVQVFPRFDTYGDNEIPGPSATVQEGHLLIGPLPLNREFDFHTAGIVGTCAQIRSSSDHKVTTVKTFEACGASEYHKNTIPTLGLDATVEYHSGQCFSGTM